MYDVKFIFKYTGKSLVSCIKKILYNLRSTWKGRWKYGVTSLYFKLSSIFIYSAAALKAIFNV